MKWGSQSDATQRSKQFLLLPRDALAKLPEQKSDLIMILLSGIRLTEREGYSFTNNGYIQFFYYGASPAKDCAAIL